MENLVNLEVEMDNKDKISTIDFRNVINDLRVKEGESKVRNDDFIKRVIDELELDIEAAKISHHPRTKSEMKYFMLTEDEALQVGMRESKAVRKGVIAWIKERKKPEFQLPQNYLEALEHLVVQVKKNELLTEENKLLGHKVEQTQSIVDEYEDRLPDKWERNLRQIANLLEVKPNKFNEILVEKGYIYKSRSIYYPKKYYKERGWFKTKHIPDHYGNLRDTFVVTNIGYKGLTRHIAQGKINIESIRTK